MDSRAVSPVVEKTLAIGLVVLFVSGFSATFLGGVVPDYRAGIGDEVGERTLATAARTVEAAVPAADGTAHVETATELPGTLAGADYRIELRGRQLRLVHPDPSIGGTTRLAIPASVTVRNGSWTGGSFVVHVSGETGNRTLSIGGA